MNFPPIVNTAGRDHMEVLKEIRDQLAITFDTIKTDFCDFCQECGMTRVNPNSSLIEDIKFTGKHAGRTYAVALRYTMDEIVLADITDNIDRLVGKYDTLIDFYAKMQELTNDA